MDLEFQANIQGLLDALPDDATGLTHAAVRKSLTDEFGKEAVRLQRNLDGLVGEVIREWLKMRKKKKKKDNEEYSDDDEEYSDDDELPVVHRPTPPAAPPAAASPAAAPHSAAPPAAEPAATRMKLRGWPTRGQQTSRWFGTQPERPETQPERPETMLRMDLLADPETAMDAGAVTCRRKCCWATVASVGPFSPMPHRQTMVCVGPRKYRAATYLKRKRLD
jgi:hypothetical protein